MKMRALTLLTLKLGQKMHLKEINDDQLPNSVDYGSVVGNVVELVINHSDYDLCFMEWGILQIIASRKNNSASFEEQSMLRITDRFAMCSSNRQYFGNQNGGKNTVAIPERLSGLSNEDICRSLIELERKSKIQQQLKDLRLEQK